MLDTVIATHLSEMRKRLDKAAEIARAADACAISGSIDAAVEVSFDRAAALRSEHTFERRKSRQPYESDGELTYPGHSPIRMTRPGTSQPATTGWRETISPPSASLPLLFGGFSESGP
jgi:hypothetical protein